MNTGEKIARLRKENNYTQEQLGEVTELGKQMATKAMRQEIPKYYQWIVKIIEKIL
jgi:transcriptional regulator with XRE-family HTH domain